MIQEMHLPSVPSTVSYPGWETLWEELAIAWGWQLPETELGNFEATVELMIRASVPHEEMTSVRKRWSHLRFYCVHFATDSNLLWDTYTMIDTTPAGLYEECDWFLSLIEPRGGDDEAVKQEFTEFLNALSVCALHTVWKVAPKFWEYVAKLPREAKESLWKESYRMAVMELLCQLS